MQQLFWTVSKIALTVIFSMSIIFHGGANASRGQVNGSDLQIKKEFSVC